MPLSEPADRELLHLRDIELRGYRRTDGDYDIEAYLMDTKSYGYGNPDRGYIQPGEPLHGLWARMTVDEGMTIVAFEAASDHTPYAICPRAAPNFASLAGLTIGPGFLKAAAARVGGTHGCTHLRELLQQMGTAAFQTIKPARARQAMMDEGTTAPGSDRYDARVAAAMGGPAAILNTCIGYGTDSPVIKRRWPHLYTGPDQDTVQPEMA
jgi:hypothetical protein